MGTCGTPRCVCSSVAQLALGRLTQAVLWVSGFFLMFRDTVRVGFDFGFDKSNSRKDGGIV